MIIDLQEPFKSKWRKGYLRESLIDGRKRVDLFNSNEDRTTISYSRYLISVKLKRFLQDSEEVDHIDGNNSNDALENLQLLSTLEHRKKTKESTKGRKCFRFTCPVCSKEFTRECRNVGSGLNFCSKHCSSTFYGKRPSSDFVIMQKGQQEAGKIVEYVVK